MTNLQHKNICVTGAGSGIGRACAEAAAAQGAALLLIGRRKRALAQTAAVCRERGAGDIDLCTLDVRDYDAVRAALQTRKPPDILINNAGLALSLDTVDAGDVDEWNRMIDTNVKGLLYMTRQLLPAMRKRGSGQIVNIGSISSHLTYAGGGVYCATKYAVAAITQTLRQELLGTAIRVNLVSPGMVDTEFSVVRFSGDKRLANETYHGMTPLAAQDVADSVMFCLSCPAHVNIDEIIVMPTHQTHGGAAVYRKLETRN